MTNPTSPTDPTDADLIALATPYALHALPGAELTEIERRVAAAPPALAKAFVDEVRAVRETMAVISAGTAHEPPPDLRGRLLAVVAADPVRALNPGVQPSVRRLDPRVHRWRPAALAAAAAVVVALAAVSIGVAMRPHPTPSTAAQVFAAPDVRTASGDIPTGGTATVVFSRVRNAGVLVMNNVAPPTPGTVYQMWLVHGQDVMSAGTMDAAAVAPSTTAVLPNIGAATELAFTVEPGSGSAHPTGAAFAELPLT
jgi:anti-sigma-K factor RskA